VQVSDITPATSYAIRLARQRGLAEVGPEELLLGCLLAISRFGVVQIGQWAIDLARYGVDWLSVTPREGGPKIAYSEKAVELFDLAAKIARIDQAGEIRVEHFWLLLIAPEFRFSSN
jgi:hypothetical protein